MVTYHWKCTGSANKNVQCSKALKSLDKHFKMIEKQLDGKWGKTVKDKQTKTHFESTATGCYWSSSSHVFEWCDESPDLHLQLALTNAAEQQKPACLKGAGTFLFVPLWWKDYCPSAKVCQTQIHWKSFSFFHMLLASMFKILCNIKIRNVFKLKLKPNQNLFRFQVQQTKINTLSLL